MAYSLRYWYNNKLTDGKVIRLEIYKKDSSAAAMEIGDVVQGISLNIDGGEDNIDAPIVSTSLVMTFCDAYDHPEADVKKCGNYAEFYTPDATLWKVVLLCKDNGSSSFRTLWGGYVTPDSYEEDLTYRGSVTIVARDNIGHMADFPFDAEGDDYGTISFREVIEGAWAKIESPMRLVFHDEWMQTEGVSALDTRMNVSAFEDKSWHEAVEVALYAYGAVLRFIGDNEVKVSPLRYMPNYGGSVTHSEPIFMTGATRMLTPAVKRIEETASYELETINEVGKIKESSFTGEVQTYGYTTSLGTGFNLYCWDIQNKTEGAGWMSNGDYPPYFNPNGYDISAVKDTETFDEECMWLALSNYAEGLMRYAEYSRYYRASRLKLHMALGMVYRIQGGRLAPLPDKKLSNRISLSIYIEQNGIRSFLQEDGTWGATQVIRGFSQDEINEGKLELEIPAESYTGIILLGVRIHGGGLTTWDGDSYVPIHSFAFEDINPLLQTSRVNTNYNEENNVIITRDPAIAPAYNTTFLPSVIKNGIFYAEGLAYKPAKAWAFAGDTPQQMAVYNHLQLLAYYAKPNNVIEGSIVNGDVSRFAHIWQFEGKEHILVSGRYNFINGYIEGAILREFARYENLWESTGDTELPATETSNETNVEASASSSSSANTYENTTTVNIGGSGGGASNLKDLQDVKLNATASGDLLYFNGSTWVNNNIHNIIASYLDLQKKLGDWFYLTEDGESIGTRFNLFSEGEVSGNGLSLGEGGGGSSDGGLITSVLDTSYLGAALINRDDTVFNAYATNEIYKATQAHDSRISILESQVGDLMVGGGSKVTVSNLLTTGTRVATITIDGTSYDVFAPVGSGGSGGSIDTSQFLSINGGTIQGGSNVTPFVINSDSASQSNPQSGMRFTVGGVSKGWLGYNSLNGCHFYNYTTGQRIGIRDSGVAFYSPSDGVYNALLHSGNYTNYTVGKDGTGATGTWGIAVTSAGKLTTKRTLWGQNFDGSANVTGNLRIGDGYLYLNNNKGMYAYDASGVATYVFGLDSSNTYLFAHGQYHSKVRGKTVTMTYGVSHTTGLILNASGNVTIGGSDLASTTTKLYVDGGIRFAPRKIWGQNFDGTGNVSGEMRGVDKINFSGDWLDLGIIRDSNGNLKTLRLQSWGGRSLSINPEGNNVGIGTSAPAEKLSVVGNIVASGEISANVLNQGSDIRFKDRIEDVALSLDTITNAPIFRFRWNDRKDDRVYVGTSAQYWKEHIAELVSMNGEGFHRLDYSTLGVIIGVTIGKVVENHEERISKIERRLKHECK